MNTVSFLRRGSSGKGKRNSKAVSEKKIKNPRHRIKGDMGARGQRVEIDPKAELFFRALR
jgi:hypothetical protein